MMNDHEQRDIRESAEEVREAITSEGDLTIKLVDHLLLATDAIEDATDALAEERRTRRNQMIAMAIAVIVGLVVATFTFINSQRIDEQAELTEIAFCEAINENRDTTYSILETLAQRGGIDADERELLDNFRKGPLEHLDCDEFPDANP